MNMLSNVIQWIYILILLLVVVVSGRPNAIIPPPEFAPIVNV